jgi:aspartate racemase
MKKLGLVGGISWVSTIDYYRYINEGINERLGGLQFAECLVYSLNFGDVQRAGWDSAGPLVIRAAKTLEQSGADAIVLCANTAHRFADEIGSVIRIPLIHIVEATAAAIRARQLRTVGLLGTKVTMESSFYVDGMAAAGIETLVPESVETRDFIQGTLKEELGRGILRKETKVRYLQVIQELVNRGAQGIILGCTEIPLLIEQQDTDIPLFDTTKIHAAAAVAFSVGGGSSMSLPRSARSS